MSGVLLVNMPFCSLRWPALGLSLLQSSLQRAGIGCDIAYFNFDLAEAIGLERYQWLNDAFGFVLGGERLFARHLFAQGLSADDDYHQEVLLAADPEFTPEDRRDFESAGAHIEPFLDACFRSTDWSRYGVVGFTTTFQQTLASAALARRLKQFHPGITICLGGANCDGAMGRELLRQFPQVDLVFSGEADRTFPEVMAQILGHQPLSLPPGVFARDPALPGAVAEHGPARRTLSRAPAAVSSTWPEHTVIENLDDLPYPDFDDYFRRLEGSPLREQIDPLLLFETARGCWWGARQQCTFCGLNGGAIGFRSKSAARALQELQHLRQRYGVRRACATDNIMDFRYFRSLLPLLQEAKLDLEFEYELKTNMTRAQVEALVAAGLGAAQLGVESFLTPVLRLMRKGVTAVQNIQTLKWLTEAGIEVKWNFLYGFPGEDPAAYAALPGLFARLMHLAPPQATGAIRIDRFSPYFESPEAFGLSRPFPHRAYQHVFPFPEQVLSRLAYYFTCDQRESSEPPGYVRPALAVVEAWREQALTATLLACDSPDGRLVLHDTRPGAAAFERRLSAPERAVYLYCDTARSLGQVVQFAAPGGNSLSESWIRPLLEKWVDEGIMIHLDGAYLSLALLGR